APAELKVRGLTTKAILKEAARGLVPDDVIRRRKRGLSVPVARWLNEDLAALADRYLAAPRLYPDAPTARLVAEHRAGTRNTARHPAWGVRLLRDRGVPDALCREILGHATYSGVPRGTPLAQTLFAVDELCGFLVACALVRPSRSFADLEVASVKKKLKDKAF